MVDGKLRQVFSEVLGIPVEEVTPEIHPAQVERWDSLGHLMLILAVEKAYGVRFRAAQIPELKSVRLIEAALKQSQ